MKRLLPVLLSLALVVATLGRASAGQEWCKDDPVVSLNSSIVDIQVAIPLQYLPLVNGPTRIYVQTPAGTKRHLIVHDLGFNLRGEVVTFSDGGSMTDSRNVPTAVWVHVPIDARALAPKETVPMQVTVMQPGFGSVSRVGTTRLTKVRLNVADTSVK